MSIMEMILIGIVILACIIGLVIAFPGVDMDAECRKAGYERHYIVNGESRCIAPGKSQNYQLVTN